MADYTVTTEAYQGPLDVLLDLIEKRKLLINDISIAEVTDDFLAYLEKRQGVPLAERAHFVHVASTLLLIKSKSLLPALELTDEETESVEDLERRLILYRRFRELSKNLDRQFGMPSLYLPEDMRPVTPLFAVPKDVTTDGLHAAIARVLDALPRKEFVPQAVVDKVISLDNMMDRLAKRIEKHISLGFREFAGMGKEDRTHVIVGFLAMLELVKRGAISVTQDSLFSDITMEHDRVNTPHYG